MVTGSRATLGPAGHFEIARPFRAAGQHNSVELRQQLIDRHVRADIRVGAEANPLGRHLLEFLEPLDGLLHGRHIGEEAAEPALVHVEHLAAGGFFGDGFLRLALGADEEYRLSLRRHFDYIPGRVLEKFQGLLQVDDVDTVTFAKDVFLHLWIPALGLVPEVNARFEQFFH